MMADEVMPSPLNPAGVDLVWDYTGDESSPLLQRARMNRSDRSCVINQNQVRYLLFSLSEVSQILSSELYRSSQYPISVHPSTVRTVSGSDYCQKFLSFYNDAVKYFPVLAIILQIMSIIIDSLLSTSHKPIASAVLVALGCLLVLLFYVEIIRRLMHRTCPSLSSLLLSYASSILLFAGLGVVSYRFDTASWGFPVPTFVPSNEELFIVTYLRMLQMSVAYFMLSYSGQPLPVSWFPCLTVSLQMIFAYCHLVITIALTTAKVWPMMSQIEVQTNGPQLPILMQDEDTESIIRFDPQTANYGTINVTPNFESGRSSVASNLDASTHFS